MDRELLEGFLAEGLSLDEIGKRVGRAPSTISYHLKRFGLTPVNQGVHANKGGIDKLALAGLLESGRSVREIAEHLDRSVATVRYWMDRHGLVSTIRSRRRKQAAQAKAAGLRLAMLECSRHGLTEFVLENRGTYRCKRCATERVSEWRRRIKRRLVEEAGGSCVICGYDRCVAALQFHHIDPSQKSFALSREGVARSYAESRAEVSKCALLCSTCHAEVEAGFTELPASLAA